MRFFGDGVEGMPAAPEDDDDEAKKLKSEHLIAFTTIKYPGCWEWTGGCISHK
jgi:hypothetical protein